MRETENIECKKSLAELSEALVSIAAILNKQGHGELWFGVKNDGSTVCLQVADTTLRKVSQAIAARIEPKIFPEVSRVRRAGKDCIHVVFSGTEAPYFAHGRAYMRVADEDRQLSARELESLILKKNAKQHWDTQFTSQGVFQADTAKLKAFLRKAGLKWTSSQSAIQNLGLEEDGKIRNAARVFFEKTPTCSLRCAVFAGTTSATILDQHDFRNDILSLIEEAEKYVLKNIRIGMKLDGLTRIDVPEIDRSALREAIINAFCHRDYRDPDEVRVAIYKDRVEIRNPGGLTDGITMRALKRGNISRRRNPIIADLLRRIRYIEAWGRGIPLILETAPDTRFRQEAGLFVTEFPRQEKPVEGSESGSELGSESESETVQSRILAALRAGALSRSELAHAIGHKTVTRALRQATTDLLATSQIERTIPDKPGSRLQKYRLTPKGRKWLDENR